MQEYHPPLSVFRLDRTRLFSLSFGTVLGAGVEKPGRTRRFGMVFGFGRSKDLVGLDIGDSSIKVVELKEVSRGRTWEVSALGQRTAAPGGDRRWDDHGCRPGGRYLAADLEPDADQKSQGGHGTVRSFGDHPPHSPAGDERAELAEQIRWEAEQYIPFNINEVSLDYHVLKGSSLAYDGNRMSSLAAARKEKIDDYTSVISRLALEPMVVDVGTLLRLSTVSRSTTATKCPPPPP